MSPKLVWARPQDAADILKFICALAFYEKLEHEVVATEESLQKTLFGPQAKAEVFFVEAEGVKVAFALFFHSYSTFLAKPGIYLEDLFVLPEHRAKGYGKFALASLARIAVERNCGRLEWSVLDWNEPALGFYRKLGAVPMNEWTVQRLTGDALSSLAQSRQ